MCRCTGMRLVNGRVFGDVLGALTCFTSKSKPSTLDYFACESDLLESVEYLNVANPSEISDHCCLSLSLRTPVFRVQKSNANVVNDSALNFRWEDSSNLDFKKALSDPLVTSIVSEICGEKHSIDENLSLFNKAFYTAAAIANIKKSIFAIFQICSNTFTCFTSLSFSSNENR